MEKKITLACNSYASDVRPSDWGSLSEYDRDLVAVATQMAMGGTLNIWDHAPHVQDSSSLTLSNCTWDLRVYVVASFD